MPETQSRTTEQIDRELGVAQSRRRNYQTDIEKHLRTIEGLRMQYARAGSRIDQLLEERLTASS